MLFYTLKLSSNTWAIGILQHIKQGTKINFINRLNCETLDSFDSILRLNTGTGNIKRVQVKYIRVAVIIIIREN